MLRIYDRFPKISPIPKTLNQQPHHPLKHRQRRNHLSCGKLCVVYITIKRMKHLYD